MRASAFGIRHLLQPDARELTIAQVQGHFPLQRIEAPVPHMFQEQQPQHHFCWRLTATQLCAVLVPFSLRLVNRFDQLLVFQ
jgi:hypothetical protein